ncbi:MAG: PaaI family thioesterase [Verrucomicrobiales bacterium]
MQQKFHTDGQEVHTHFVPKPDHVGFSTVVHGGIVATLLDEIMVWACAVQTSSFAYCAELNVRYQKPVLPEKAYIARARLDENKKNRIFISSGEVVDEQGVVYATSTGKYIPIPWEQAVKMFADFEGEPEEIKRIIDKIRERSFGK